MNNDWITDLKVGDEVYTIETHEDIPNGYWKWKSKVIAIESNYIETSYVRDFYLEWLIELTKKLVPNHRTYARQWVKNYISPDGRINIEKIND